MQIGILRLAFTAAASAIALALGIAAGHAATVGDQPWCAVYEEAGGNTMWECEYLKVDDCSPAIIAGNRGFCALNPYWQPPQSSTEPQSLAPSLTPAREN